MMDNKKDSPGVYIPASLIYITIFLAGVFIQEKVPIPDALFHKQLTTILGAILLIVAFFFLVKSLAQFVRTRNTIITIKPASSLLTTGIFSVSRNPMYIGVAMAYLGTGCLIGNWWNIILFPVLLLVIQEYIIKSEEKYLERRFGEEYILYKSRVRRWF